MGGHDPKKKGGQKGGGPKKGGPKGHNRIILLIMQPYFGPPSSQSQINFPLG